MSTERVGDRARGRVLANALSILRLLLAWPFVSVMARSDEAAALWAAALFAVAIGSDLLDGWWARRSGSASAAGRLLDHTADFTFVSAGLAGAAMRGSVPGWLALLVGLAFVQYLLDSGGSWRKRELRMSRLGRWNGVLYFVLLGGDILGRLGAAFVAVITHGLAWGLALTTLISIADRACAVVRRRRTVRGLPGAGTPTRSPR